MSVAAINYTYRKLSSEEVGQLILQGCSCDDWSLVEVNDRFSTDNIRGTHFSGSIKLGAFIEKHQLYGGISKLSGIYNSWLNNCIVDDNVLIHNVRGYISNYHIEPDVVIHNVGTLAVEGSTGFGNGVRVKAINEQGGRDVPIYDHLNTHMAYILALYRHRSNLKDRIESLVSDYVGYITSDVGVVGRGSRIINCDDIRNVKLGEYAVLQGVRKLYNGSINSCRDDNVIIGNGVIMENFIVNSGSTINDATIISNCFIGQGCILDKQYSAVESLFFANCQGFHGEACSIFAGPYTVTHHKSTLLIAGMFSFLNAGSGSNQSNHMYKLGPVHQGVVERGVKTTSDSYLLWPSRVGAFSLVMGRHYKHSDTSDFPFSYLIENNDESILVPAINLRSIGIIRDSKKWPVRDKRKDPNILDQINFNLLSPYTVQKMMNGRDLLVKIKESNPSEEFEYRWERMIIRKSALEKGEQLYKLAITKFLGNSLLTRLHGKKLKGVEEIFERLEPDTPVGAGKWVDLSGLICPYSTMEELFKDIESGALTSIEEINATLATIHSNYYSYEWTWASEQFEDQTGKKLIDFSVEDLISFIEKWRDAVLQLDTYLHEDASKEFSDLKMTGFGIDGSAKERLEDFESVRGSFEENPMVVSIKNHKENKKQLGDEIIKTLRGLIK